MLNIAKSLASHDVSIRNEGIKMVESWLRTSKPSPVEMQKTWGALFFCMWHSDKPLVQHELAQKLAKTQYLLIETPLRFQWIRSFWEVHTSKWNGIDKHRLDKFYSLLRYFLNETIQILYKTEWDKESIDLYVKILSEIPLSSSAPRGVIFHLADLYLEELEKVLQDNPIYTLQGDILLALLEPFFNLLKSGDKFTIKRVNESIFTGLLDNWSELLDPSSLPTSAFEQRKEYILNSMVTISEKLLNLSTSLDIPSPNRTALYNARVGFEEILNELGKDLKKRKIDQDVSVASSEKDLKKRKIEDVSSETSEDEVTDEVINTADPTEEVEIEGFEGAEDSDDSDESDDNDEDEEESDPPPPEPEPKKIVSPKKPKNTPGAQPNTSASLPKLTSPTLKQLPSELAKPAVKEPSKVEPQTVAKTVDVATAKPISKATQKPNANNSTTAPSTLKNTATAPQNPPKTTIGGTKKQTSTTNTSETTTNLKQKPQPNNQALPSVARTTVSPPATTNVVTIKGRPSTTQHDQPKLKKSSPLVNKKAEEKKKVIFNLEKNKSVDLNVFQFDSNKPHRPHAQPKTGILKTVATHNPIKRNKFNQKTKKLSK